MSLVTRRLQGDELAYDYRLCLNKSLTGSDDQKPMAPNIPALARSTFRNAAYIETATAIC